MEYVLDIWDFGLFFFFFLVSLALMYLTSKLVESKKNPVFNRILDLDFLVK